MRRGSAGFDGRNRYAVEEDAYMDAVSDKAGTLVVFKETEDAPDWAYEKVGYRRDL